MSIPYLGYSPSRNAGNVDLDAMVPAGRTTPDLPTYLSNNASINILDEGAKIDGSTDDSAAIRTAISKAIADGRGIVDIPPGLTLIGSSIINHTGIFFRGWGNPQGGVGAQRTVYSNIIKEFSGDAFVWDGAAGGVAGGGGGAINLRVVQGSVGPSMGRAFRVIAADASHTAAWVKFINCIVEETVGGHWSMAWDFDGGSYGIGPFDCWLIDCSSHTQGSGAGDGALRINGTGGFKAINNAFYDSKGDIIVGDANFAGQIQLIGCDGGSLKMDHCGALHLFAGTWTQCSDTVNTTGPIRLIPGYLQVPFTSNSLGGAAAATIDYSPNANDAFQNGAWTASRPFAVQNGMNFSGFKAAGDGSSVALVGLDTSDRVRIQRNGSQVTTFGQVTDFGDFGPGEYIFGGVNGTAQPRIRIGPKSFIMFGDGTPQGNVSAKLGSLYSDTLNGVLYYKQTNDGGSTGWVVK